MTMTRRANTDLAIAMAGLALLLLSAVSAVTSTSPKVTMRFAAGDGSATLTGVESTSSIDFLGIPFAEPPTGPRRFQPATPKSISSSEFNATSFGAACPQPACMHSPQVSLLLLLAVVLASDLALLLARVAPSPTRRTASSSTSSFQREEPQRAGGPSSCGSMEEPSWRVPRA